MCACGCVGLSRKTRLRSCFWIRWWYGPLKKSISDEDQGNVEGWTEVEVRGGGYFIYYICWSLMRSASALLYNAWWPTLLGELFFFLVMGHIQFLIKQVNYMAPLYYTGKCGRHNYLLQWSFLIRNGVLTDSSWMHGCREGDCFAALSSSLLASV